MIKINPSHLFNSTVSAEINARSKQEKSDQSQAAEDRFEKTSRNTEEKIGSEVQGSKKSKKKSSLRKNTEMAERIQDALDTEQKVKKNANSEQNAPEAERSGAAEGNKSKYPDWKNTKQNTYSKEGTGWKSNWNNKGDGNRWNNKGNGNHWNNKSNWNNNDKKPPYNSYGGYQKKQYSPKMDPAVMGSPSEYFNDFLPNLMKRAGIQYPPELMQAQQEMMNHSYRFSLMQQEVQMQQAALNTHLQILNGIMQMNLDVFQSQNKNVDTIIAARQKVYAMNNKTFATMFQNTMAVAEAWMTALTTTPRL